MTKTKTPETAGDRIAELSDARLQALAFRAWRAASGKSPRARARAQRLAPLFRAEIRLRNLGGAAQAAPTDD